jgi:hypothetical protein
MDLRREYPAGMLSMDIAKHHAIGIENRYKGGT